MNPPELGLVERSVLSTMDAHNIGPLGDFVNSAVVCDRINADTGLSPGHAWQGLLDMARPWAIPVPLIEFRGNYGSPDDLPADVRYTQVRLSLMGEFVASTRRAGVVLPIPLVEGDMFCGGRRPPFEARRVVGALRRLLADPQCADAVLAELLGEPVMPTGARVEVDLDLLMAGGRVEVEIAARFEPCEDRWIDVTRLPPGVGSEAAFASIKKNAQVPEGRLTLNGITDLSSGDETLIRLGVQEIAHRDVLMEILDRTWPLRISTDLELRAPAAEILRAWAGQFTDSTDASKWLNRFETLLPRT